MALIGEETRGTGARPRADISLRCEKEMVESRAAARLQRSPYPEVHRVACEFHEGMLRLRGRVPSYYIKQIAQTVVLGIDGVEEIHNQVEVVAPPEPR